MKIATTDRGAVLHHAGCHSLSPALQDGRPLLVTQGDTAGRCGWQSFFEAAERAGLALAWDSEDPRAALLVPGGEAAEMVPHPTLAKGLARTRRFLAALRGPPAA